MRKYGAARRTSLACRRRRNRRKRWKTRRCRPLGEGRRMGEPRHAGQRREVVVAEIDEISPGVVIEPFHAGYDPPLHFALPFPSTSSGLSIMPGTITSRPADADDRIGKPVWAAGIHAQQQRLGMADVPANPVGGDGSVPFLVDIDMAPFVALEGTTTTILPGSTQSKMWPRLAKFAGKNWRKVSAGHLPLTSRTLRKTRTVLLSSIRSILAIITWVDQAHMWPRVNGGPPM